MATGAGAGAGAGAVSAAERAEAVKVLNVVVAEYMKSKQRSAVARRKAGADIEKIDHERGEANNAFVDQAIQLAQLIASGAGNDGASVEVGQRAEAFKAYNVVVAEYIRSAQLYDLESRKAGADIKKLYREYNEVHDAFVVDMNHFMQLIAPEHPLSKIPFGAFTCSKCPYYSPNTFNMCAYCKADF